MYKLSRKDIEIIFAMCEENLNCSAVVRKHYVHHNTVIYHLKRIKQNTGLDPKNFHNLIELEIMAKEIYDQNDQKSWYPII